MKKLFLYILISPIVALWSCNYLDIEPIGKVIPKKVSDYRALMTSAYNGFPNHKKMLSLSSDETEGLMANDFGQVNMPFFYNLTWQHNSSPAAAEFSYMSFYKTFFYTIEVMDKVMDSESDVADAPAARKQLMAEAHALRAYGFFDMLNLYADYKNLWYTTANEATDRGVPLYKVIDIQQRFVPVSVKETFDFIFEDIAVAEENMQIEKQPETTLHHFSKNAVTALKSRISLYRGEWQKAYDAAVSLQAAYALVDMNATMIQPPFSSKSTEAIYTLEAPVSTDFVLSNTLVNSYDQDNDKRWGVYVAREQGENKIKKFISGERISFRVAEMYLIAAEAMANLATGDADANLTIAKTQLKALLEKRYATEYFTATKSLAIDAMDKTQLLEEIAVERLRELCFEGHRWLDLKRTTRPAITKAITIDWETTEYKLAKDDPRYLFNFPRSAVTANPDLAK